MTTLKLDVRGTRAPLWLWGLAGFGVIWNLFGTYRFAAGLTAAGREAMVAGLTATQAEVYLSLPLWMNVVFAVGVLGGLLGSLALAARRAAAVPLLGISLIGYIALFSGDLHYGVFDAIPGQLAILTFVVAVAVALLAGALAARSKELLRASNPIR